MAKDEEQPFGEDDPSLKLLAEVARVGRAGLLPGDVVVVECPRELSRNQSAFVTGHLEKIWPGHRVLILDAGMRIHVVRETDLPKIPDEAPSNYAARRYMAEKMGMTDVYEDQDQNWILGHLATFGLELAEALAEIRKFEDLSADARAKLDALLAPFDAGTKLDPTTGFCADGRHDFDRDGNCKKCPKVIMTVHPETRTGR